MKCNHKYVDMEDGTRDKLCVKCGKKVKQAAMYMKPKNEIQINNISENATDKILKEIARDIASNKVLGR